MPLWQGCQWGALAVPPQVFYFHEGAYPPTTGRFSGRVTWDGNAAKGDASILLWSVSPTHNGTFVCQVRNPPDVEGGLGEIQLCVVLTGVPEDGGLLLGG